MKNVGMEDLSYDSFKLAYDSDPVIQAFTHRYDQNGIELATSAQKKNDARSSEVEKDSKVVSQMAKSATKRAMADS